MKNNVNNNKNDDDDDIIMLLLEPVVDFYENVLLYPSLSSFNSSSSSSCDVDDDDVNNDKEEVDYENENDEENNNDDSMDNLICIGGGGGSSSSDNNSNNNNDNYVIFDILKNIIDDINKMKEQIDYESSKNKQQQLESNKNSNNRRSSSSRRGRAAARGQLPRGQKGGRRTNQKVNALDKQQKARLLQKQESNNDEDNNNNNDEEEQINYNSTLRLVRTINSIRLLFPILINMFTNGRKDIKNVIDEEEEEGKNDGREKKKQKQQQSSSRRSSSKNKKQQQQSRSIIQDKHVYGIILTKHIKKLLTLMNRVLTNLLHITKEEGAGVGNNNNNNNKSGDNDEEQNIKLLLLNKVMNNNNNNNEEIWNIFLRYCFESSYRDEQHSTCNSMKNPIGILLSNFDDDKNNNNNKKKNARCDDIISIGRLYDQKFILPIDNNEYNNYTSIIYRDSIHYLIQDLIRSIRHKYSNFTLKIYGSCLNGLSIDSKSDVDISISFDAASYLKTSFDNGHVTAEKFERTMKSFVYNITNCLRNSNNNARNNGSRRSQSHNVLKFTNLEPITRARIPVIKGTYIYEYSKNNNNNMAYHLNFDICFLNDIAVQNSRLLLEYTLVDDRIRSLMKCIKLFTRQYKINEAKNNYLSSYTWMNLVIYYLQYINIVPNLQQQQQDNHNNHSSSMNNKDDNDNTDNINGLITSFMTWDEVMQQQQQNSSSSSRSKKKKKKESQNMSWCDIVEEQQEEEGISSSSLRDLPISLLLYGFFHFYSNVFPYGTHAVSIQKGGYNCLSDNNNNDSGNNNNSNTSRRSFIAENLKTRHSKSYITRLCIEDPFETFHSHIPHDLGSPLTDNEHEHIMNLLCNAEKVLRNDLLQQQQQQQQQSKNNDIRLTCLWTMPESIATGTGSRSDSIADGNMKHSSRQHTQQQQGQQQQQQQQQQQRKPKQSHTQNQDTKSKQQNGGGDGRSKQQHRQQQQQGKSKKGEGQPPQKQRGAAEQTQQQQQQRQQPDVPSPSLEATTKANTGNNNAQIQTCKHNKRDPDCTLVIKNIPENAKESEFREVFDQFAKETNTKILGINISSRRGLAFVDYDAVPPVVAAMKKQEKDGRFRIGGRNIHVEQKSSSQQRMNQNNSRSRRSSRRSNSNKAQQQSPERTGVAATTTIEATTTATVTVKPQVENNQNKEQKHSQQQGVSSNSRNDHTNHAVVKEWHALVGNS